jgi:hypothetical protein
MFFFCYNKIPKFFTGEGHLKKRYSEVNFCAIREGISNDGRVKVYFAVIVHRLRTPV